MNYQKSTIKHEVKWMMVEGIDKEELVLLKFTKEESETALRWKHSKEFEYNRQMYDIVETTVIGDTIYYYCWLDSKETKLNKQLAKLVTNIFNHNPQKREKQARLFSYFKSCYCSNHFSWNSNIFVYEVKPNLNFSNIFESLLLTPPTPPPRLS